MTLDHYTGSFTILTEDYISPHLSEGPVICKAINADRWYLYYDMFMEGGIFKCSTTTNLDGNTSEWAQLPDDQFTLPKRIRNGHILEIDREELNRLRDVWDNGPHFAEDCKASASSAKEGNPASNANDLNYNTYWSAAAGKGANEWLEIDLGTNRTFNKTIVRQTNSDRISGYKIQYHNGTEWVDAYTGGAMGTKVKIDTFPPVTASKVRLLVTAVQPTASARGETDTCPQINEFDIYLIKKRCQESECAAVELLSTACATSEQMMSLEPTVEVTFSTKAGKMYQLQVKADSGWENSGFAISGTGNPYSRLCKAGDYRVISPSKEWLLVWADEFEGNDLDYTRWEKEENNDGGGNNERQAYRTDPKYCFVQDGHLNIAVYREPHTTSDGKTQPYSSARIRTKKTRRLEVWPFRGAC